MQKITGTSAPKISAQLLNDLERAFAPRPIQPETERDRWMWEAGAASVVRWIHDKLATSSPDS